MTENLNCITCERETPHELAAKNEVGGAMVCTICGSIRMKK